MKKILILALLVLTMSVFGSCKSDEADEPKRYPNENQIQGLWGCTRDGRTYLFDFSKPDYAIYVKYGNKDELETGKYTMNSKGEIFLTPNSGKESLWSPLEAYFEGPGTNMVHFWPVGTFIKTK